MNSNSVASQGAVLTTNEFTRPRVVASALLAVAALCTGGLPLAQGLCFEGNTALPIGVDIGSLVSGDLDGDGGLDFIVENGGAALVYLNQGGGSFAAPVAHAAGSGNLGTFVLGDLNGDGRLDLAVPTTNGHTVAVLLNLGGGNFSAVVEYAAGTNPVAVAIGDIDGDGDRDLVSTDSSTNLLSVLINQGNGAFWMGNPLYPLGTGAGSVALADMSGDGRLDVVVANATSNDVSILVNQGFGTFVPQVRYAVGTTPRGLVVRDLDGDGRADIATANGGSNNVSVRLAPSFAVLDNYPAGPCPYALCATDLDGDGRLDLVKSTTCEGSLAVLRNLGGTFAAPATYATAEQQISIASGDVDGDGDQDLLGSHGGIFGANSVWILHGAGNGTLEQPIEYPTPPASAVAVADLDGDGILDAVVCAGPSNNVAVLLGLGDGTFQPAGLSATGFTPVAVAIGDIDGDGRPDFVTANRNSGNVSVMLGLGGGAFAPQATYAAGSGPTDVALGDVDGDLRLDAVVTNRPSSTVAVLLGTGSGAFAAPVSYATAVSPEGVALGDVDNDGDLDVVAATYGIYGTAAGGVSVLKNQGTGTFAPQQFHAGFGFANSIALGDLDQDGDLDCVLSGSGYHYDGGRLSRFTNNGAGTFLNSTAPASGQSPRAVELADFDGDGALDVASANSAGQSVTVARNSGGGVFSSTGEFPVFAAPIGIDSGDFDRDGDLDVLAADSDGGLIVLRSCLSTGEVYCSGDGSGTACPCGNASAIGSGVGCLNSLGTGGRLRASGTATLAHDSVVLSGSQMTNGTVLYFQGSARTNGGAGSVFGDGLVCAGGSVFRLGTKSNSGGASSYPGSADPRISVRGAIPAPGTRYYQAYYRNIAAFCTPSGFNMTNGVKVRWEP